MVEIKLDISQNDFKEVFFEIISDTGRNDTLDDVKKKCKLSKNGEVHDHHLLKLCEIVGAVITFDYPNKKAIVNYTKVEAEPEEEDTPF